MNFLRACMIFIVQFSKMYYKLYVLIMSKNKVIIKINVFDTHKSTKGILSSHLT